MKSGLGLKSILVVCFRTAWKKGDEIHTQRERNIGTNTAATDEVAAADCGGGGGGGSDDDDLFCTLRMYHHRTLIQNDFLYGVPIQLGWKE